MNKSIYKGLIFSLAVILLAFTQAKAQSGFTAVSASDELKKKILDKANSSNTIYSQFVQEKHLSIFDEIMISQGEFYFSKPNLIRWQYNDPIKYTIVLNGKKVQILDGEKLKEYDMNSNPIFKEINTILLSSLNGEILDSKDFKIEFFKSKDQYMARLLPQLSAMTDVLSSIEIYFNAMDYGVVALKLKESSEDFTIIQFKQRITNGEIPKNTFQLRP